MRLFWILFCAALMGGCGESLSVRKRTDELCRILFCADFSESFCDSVVLRAGSLPVECRLQVLLEAVRCDRGGNSPNRVELWLQEAYRIVPEDRIVEVRMEEFRYHIMRNLGRLNRVGTKKMQADFVRMGNGVRLNPLQDAWFRYYKLISCGSDDDFSDWVEMKKALLLVRKIDQPLLEIRMKENFARMAVWSGNYEWGRSLWEDAYCQRKDEGLVADGWIYWVWLKDCYYRAGQFPEALDCCRQLLGIAGERKAAREEKLACREMVEVYKAMDSIPQALNILRRMEKNGKRDYENAVLWGEISGLFEREQKQDSMEYYCRKAVACWERLYPEKVLSKALPSYVRYAAILWRQGEHQEAVRLLRKMTDRIPKYSNPDDPAGGIHLLPYLEALTQLSGYYMARNEFRPAAELLVRQDSLRRLYTDSDNWFRNQKLTELYRSKELQEKMSVLDRQLLVREKMMIGISVLCVTLAGIALMFWVLYRQKRRSLDEIYLKQKELEKLADKKICPEPDGAEMLLFQRLEKLVLEQKLYHNPNLMLDDLCPLVGANRSYVSACVNKGGGVNFCLWINKIRVEEVLRAIRNGENDLIRLAAAVGFASQASFYRNFKQITQMTPRQYMIRERQRNR